MYLWLFLIFLSNFLIRFIKCLFEEYEEFLKSIKIELRKKLSDDQLKDFKNIWTNALAYRRTKISQIAIRKLKKLKKE